MLIVPAMLTRQRFYGAFARHLAASGIDAITWSNRGVGESLSAETTPWDVQLGDWGERDLPAVIAHARAAHPEDRLFAVCHSMGGQIVALSDAVHELDGIVTVAATSAWWGNWPRRARYAILAWYSALPILGRLLDPFPAGRFGVGPDTRGTLVRDWARWGRARGYVEAPRFGFRSRAAQFEGRVLVWSFADDPFLGNLHAVQVLHREYRHATHVHHDPRPGSVGHFGFFREPNGAGLWARTIAWMEE